MFTHRFTTVEQTLQQALHNRGSVSVKIDRDDVRAGGVAHLPPCRFYQSLPRVSCAFLSSAGFTAAQFKTETA